MTPIMIVTRPAPQGADFAAAIQAAWGEPVRIILSPLLYIAPVAGVGDLSGISVAIFTSVNGVAQAKALGLPPGTVAYCVGEQTANAAARVGFVPVTGPGDAEHLIALILALRPAGVLAHIRGRHARGNIADALTDAGLPCRDVIAYDQHAKPLTDIAQKALQGQNPVVVPLFSARTCTIFQRSGQVSAPLHVVAISPAALPTDLHAVTTTVASVPDRPAMIRATLDCLRAIKEGDHGIPLA